MMTSTIIRLLPLTCLPLVLGCGPVRPDGIPKLHPVEVTLVNAGAPVAEAIVIFAMLGDNPGSWSISAATNAAGTAVMTTSQGAWRQQGVPAGEYRIFLSKPPVLKEPFPPGLSDNPEEEAKYLQQREKREAALPREIPETLSNAALSPLRITVSADAPAETTIDIAGYFKK